MPRSSSSSSRKKRSGETRSAAAATANADASDSETEDVSMMFSQQMPEMSQPVAPAKDKEKQNLESLDQHVREKLLTTLSRLILFKALAGETIDKTKVYKEAAAGEHGATITKRVATAAFEEAKKRLLDVFGFELVMIPAAQAAHLSKTYSNRYYVINKVKETGEHSKQIHAVHASSSVERGLLMLVLALAYCRGETRKGHRWVKEETLYRLLNSIDENIPSEPPAPSTGGGKKKGSGGGGRSRRTNPPPADDEDASSGPYGTPDVDTAIDRFVHLDYLIKEKVTPVGAAADAGVIEYAMGPRSYLEVGRKQVLSFCAEVLGEEIDPTMLAELEEGEEDAREEGEAMEVE
mmetsp:Transcript_14999/g.32679  ORF Transcript_14999/g.32679 Transcript_14999/m.32679 type:complete len:350 (+) Transcript_14999:206-1255(+)|eukprot:CAMPEP_0178620252 /NCGR_PEP_ID=MMETSP0698-20121128/5187_1 /TAXON_ID=265572 /ORGANISM="Extubocellulus spinifer, Strain CCMP396" /LENGTH=349 /DNA_ID=CAMNT_0020259219 /DNA_START=219 /DNA_END=1268 /DNA_ORIENTATION=+